MGAPCDLSGSFGKDFGSVPFAAINAILFENDMDSYDPSQIIRNHPEVASLMPPIRLFHGTKDRLIRWELTAKFATLLSEMGCDEVTFTPYHEYEHSEAAIERYIIGDIRYHCDLYSSILKWKGASILLEDEEMALLSGTATKLCPKWMMVIGRWCKPC
jgi:hypothetical protein